MKLRKAEFRRELELVNLMSELNNLKTQLFGNIKKGPNIDRIEKWSPDFDQIFRILQLNYNNPRAMNCFVLYDITENKLRVQIAKYLLEKGCQRIQKSVFLANISKSIYTDIYSTFVELESIFGSNDSIFMIPIGEYHLAEMKMVGKDVDMSFSKASQYVLYF